MDSLDAFAGDYDKYLAEIALKKRIPLSGTFELLPVCNMRCRMCYIVHENIGANPLALKDVNWWDNLIDQAVEAGTLYLLLTGGEPFLYPGIRELLQRIDGKPVYTVINTNGTLLNRELVRWLADIRPSRLNISLYGASDETYGQLCGNPRGFTQVTNAFALLNEYHIPFRVHVTLTPYNFHDFQGMIDTANRYRAPMQMASYMFPPYRKDQGLMKNPGRFTPAEMARASFVVYQNTIKDPEARRIQLEGNCACFEKPELYSLYGHREMACRSGRSNYWVDWRGQLSGCGVYTGEKIDLHEVAFAQAWQRVVAATEETCLSEKCACCKYRCICPVCAAAAFCETDDVGGTPEYLCEFSKCYAELLKEELERLKHGQL